MEFGFTPEQEELRATVRAFLTRMAGASKATAAAGEAPLWARLTGELGLTALPIGERHGGFGATLVEVGLVLEQTGAALLPDPYLSTVTAAAAVAADAPGELLAGLAAGTTVGTLAVAEPGVGWDTDRLSCTARPDVPAGPGGERYLIDGVKEHVLDGHIADVAVVAAVCGGEVGLFAVRTADAARTVHSTLDQTRCQARLSFAGTPAIRVSPAGDAGAAAAHAVDLVRAALAIESIGVAQASLARTIEYLGTREQFGAPLSSFQALRHRVADLAVTLEAATSSAWYALRCAGTGEFAVAAPLAKLVATAAAYTVTAQSIQLHGGIGFTWEHDAHRYFKRATANQLLFGDPVSLRRLIGARAGI